MIDVGLSNEIIKLIGLVDAPDIYGTMLQEIHSHKLCGYTSLNTVLLNYVKDDMESSELESIAITVLFHLPVLYDITEEAIKNLYDTCLKAVGDTPSTLMAVILYGLSNEYIFYDYLCHKKYESFSDLQDALLIVKFLKTEDIQTFIESIAWQTRYLMEQYEFNITEIASTLSFVYKYLHTIKTNKFLYSLMRLVENRVQDCPRLLKLGWSSSDLHLTKTIVLHSIMLQEYPGAEHLYERQLKRMCTEILDTNEIPNKYSAWLHNRIYESPVRHDVLAILGYHRRHVSPEVYCLLSPSDYSDNLYLDINDNYDTIKLLAKEKPHYVKHMLCNDLRKGHISKDSLNKYLDLLNITIHAFMYQNRQTSGTFTAFKKLFKIGALRLEDSGYYMSLGICDYTSIGLLYLLSNGNIDLAKYLLTMSSLSESSLINNLEVLQRLDVAKLTKSDIKSLCKLPSSCLQDIELPDKLTVNSLSFVHRLKSHKHKLFFLHIPGTYKKRVELYESYAELIDFIPEMNICFVARSIKISLEKLCKLNASLRTVSNCKEYAKEVFNSII